MQPSSINSEYFENYIQYSRQANEQICKENSELEDRVNVAILKLETINESLNHIHQTNEELKSTLKKIKTDVDGHDDLSNTWKLISIGFCGLSVLTSLSICYYTYPHVVIPYAGSYSITVNGGR